MTDQLPECTCPLIDISTWGGKPSFALGNPRGTGCPIHETQQMRDEIKDAEHEARYGQRASGGPISPGATYWVGEDGPAPLVLPEGFTRYIRNDKGGWIQVDPQPEPPKRAWFEYHWPPLVLAIIALITSITAIISALGE